MKQTGAGYTFSVHPKENGKVEWRAEFEDGETVGELDPEAAIEIADLLKECARMAKAKEFDNAEGSE